MNTSPNEHKAPNVKIQTFSYYPFIINLNDSSMEALQQLSYRHNIVMKPFEALIEGDI